MSYLKHKENSLEDMAKKMQIHTQESGYKAMFKKELDKAGKGIGSMTPKEKKDFFNKVDSKHTAKNETVKEDKDPCWKDYEMVGMKKKDGKEVPNCVPKKEDTAAVWETAAQEKEKLEKEAKYMKAESKDEIPPIAKDNKPGVKIAKIRAMKGDDKGNSEDQVQKLQGQVDLLKQKLENEKHKAVKPAPNKDTGEVPLSIGIAYKHLRDKMKKEDGIKEDVADDVKEITVADKTQKRDKEMKEPKGKTMTGEKKTPVEMNPKMNHKF